MALSFIDTKNGETEGNSPRTVSTSAGINVSVGNLIVVTVALSGASAATFGDVTDTAGNTFTKLAQIGSSMRHYYCIATAANAADVFSCTITYSSYGYLRIIASVYGTSGYTVTYNDSKNSTGYGTALDTPDVSSTTDNSIWVCGASASGPRTHSNQTIAGAAATVNAGTDGRINQFYRILTSATTDDAQDTTGSDTSWALELLAFNATPAAGGLSIPVAMYHYKEH
jgi:hypothetical protein